MNAPGPGQTVVVAGHLRGQRVHMLRHFLHEQHVRPLQDYPCQRGSVPPAARQLIDRQTAMLGVETQLRQSRVDAVRIRPAVQRLHSLQQNGLPI